MTYTIEEVLYGQDKDFVSTLSGQSLLGVMEYVVGLGDKCLLTANADENAVRIHLEGDKGSVTIKEERFV